MPGHLKIKLKRDYARFKRRGSKATFIALTGSSAKSTTTALLSHILSAKANVKTQVRGNDDKATWKTLASVRREHNFVVLELGMSAPGELAEMARVVKPDIAIVTLVALEHCSAFRSKDAIVKKEVFAKDSIAKEKGSLVEALSPNGLAILNSDDDHVGAMSNLTSARVVTFGESAGDYIVSKVQSHTPGRLRLSITHRGDKFDLITRLTGAHNWLAVAAAFSCAHHLGVSPSICQERIASFEPIFGRCSVHPIENGPILIADTVKAPYHSVHLAINMMAQFSAPRKRIVLGQISDMPGVANPKYRDFYRAARDIVDQVIFVGDKAHRSKATAAEISEGRFVEKRSVKEAATFLKETAMPGEIILLKSSKNLHLERVLLNFQSTVRCWEHSCKKTCQCDWCGLYDLPFGDHP